MWLECWVDRWKPLEICGRARVREITVGGLSHDGTSIRPKVQISSMCYDVRQPEIRKIRTLYSQYGYEGGKICVLDSAKQRLRPARGGPKSDSCPRELSLQILQEVIGSKVGKHTTELRNLLIVDWLQRSTGNKRLSSYLIRDVYWSSTP